MPSPACKRSPPRSAKRRRDRSGGTAEPGKRWIALGPEIGLVVERPTARTCLVRGTIPSQADAFAGDGGGV